MALSKKYQRLKQHLIEGGDDQHLSFDTLEHIMEGPISPVYFEKNVVFGNGSRLRQAAEEAGFAITEFSVEDRHITFVRGGDWPNNTREREGQEEGEQNGKKQRINFERTTLEDDDALKIVIETMKRLYNHRLATTREDCPGYRRLTQAEIDTYFIRSDRDFLDTTPPLSDIPFIYKELAFHAQNGTDVENIVDFMNPTIQSHINNATHNYDPSLSLVSKTLFISMNTKYSGYTGNNLQVIDSYYDCLEDARLLLTGCHTANDVKDKILTKLDGTTATLPKDIYKNLKRFIKHRYRVALTFDFLKEFGRSFGFASLDYPKPDLHVKRTMIFIFNKREYIEPYLGNTTGFDVDKTLKVFTAIDLHMELVEKAKRALRDHGGTNYAKLQNYVLDKAIYIVCSGFFYLPGHSNKKNRFYGVPYTRWLGERNYLHTPLNERDITWLDDLLGRI